jgi:hypothetical protein
MIGCSVFKTLLHENKTISMYNFLAAGLLWAKNAYVYCQQQKKKTKIEWKKNNLKLVR